MQFYLLKIPTTLNTAKITTSTATMLAPTGVDARMEISMPATVPITEMIAAQIVTERKLLNTRMADSAGKIISADTNSEPTSSMASTITNAVIIAIM